MKVRIGVILIALLAAACTPAAIAPPTSTVAPTVAPTTAPTAVPTVLPAIATAVVTPQATDVPAPTEGDVATFTSDELGIRFNYERTLAAVLAQDDKVYVYATGSEPTQGQYVQVFSKDPGQSLVDAIKATVLQGYSAADCLVSVPEQGGGIGAGAPASFQFAVIDVPRGPDDALPDLNAKAAKCPAGMTNIGGLAYFAADSQHPDKFAFLSIGQYAIPGAGQVPWQNTIEFLDNTAAAGSQPTAPAGANPLSGTAWKLAAIETSGATTPVLSNSQVTLEFQAGGQAVGSAGCNGFGGDYTASDITLTFGMLISTLRACSDDAVMQQEQQYLHALQDVTAYTLTGSQLALAYPDGILHFTR